MAGHFYTSVYLCQLVKFLWFSLQFRVSKPNARITQREREICFRVQQVRRTIGWQQSNFARQIGITRDRLANIERGRTPLRFDLAVRICRVFDVRIEWLASGKLPIRPYIPVFWSYEKNAKMQSIRLLTQAFDFLEGQISSPINEISKKELAKDVPADFDFKKQLLFHIKRVCETTQFINVYDSWKFYDKVISFVYREIQKYLGEGRAIRPITLEALLSEFNYSALQEFQTYKKSELTLLSTSESIEGMNQWHKLKKRIRKVTSGPGEKSALAKFLGVDLTQLSRWLRDSENAPEPLAGLALKMLEWVQQQERQ